MEICLLCLHPLNANDAAVAGGRCCICVAPIPFTMAGGVLPPCDDHRHSNYSCSSEKTAMCPTCRVLVTRNAPFASVCSSCFAPYCWVCEAWGEGCLCGDGDHVTTAPSQPPDRSCDSGLALPNRVAAWRTCRFCDADVAGNIDGSLQVEDLTGEENDSGDAHRLESESILVPDLSAGAGGGAELNLNDRQRQYVDNHAAHAANWTFGVAPSESVPVPSNAAGIDMVPSAEARDEEGNLRVRIATFFTSLVKGVMGGSSSETSVALSLMSESEGDIVCNQTDLCDVDVSAATGLDSSTLTATSRPSRFNTVPHTKEDVTRMMWGDDTGTSRGAPSVFVAAAATTPHEAAFHNLFHPNATATRRICCLSMACQHQARSVCGRTLPCGHPCYGAPHAVDSAAASAFPDGHLHVRPCLPCLHEDCPCQGLSGKALLVKLREVNFPLPPKHLRRLLLSQGHTTAQGHAPNQGTQNVCGSSPVSVTIPPTHQTHEEPCCICYTDPLKGRGCLQLSSCGHVFHLDCILERLKHRWPTKRISFHYLCCPVCGVEMQAKALEEVLRPHLAFKGYITTMILSRIEAEGLKKCDALTSPTSEYFKNPVAYGMRYLSFYNCHKCACPYFGGFNWCDAVVLPPDGALARNEEEGANDEEDADNAHAAPSIKDSEYCCNDCTVGREKSNCVVHGRHFIQYKCRYCCSVARWFCWGTTRFCNACHAAQVAGNYLNKRRPHDLPQCGSYWESKSLQQEMSIAPPLKPLSSVACPPSLSSSMNLPSHAAKVQVLAGIWNSQRGFSHEESAIDDGSDVINREVSPNQEEAQHEPPHKHLLELRSAGLLKILAELSSNQHRATQHSAACTQLQVVHPPNGTTEFCLGCSLCAKADGKHTQTTHQL